MDFKDGERQAQLLERLGEIKFGCKGEEFAMSHETRICGRTVEVPVMVIHIPEGTQDLISDVHLKELQKTPAQRRAEKLNRDVDDRHNPRARPR